jgi:predicted deacylase
LFNQLPINKLAGRLWGLPVINMAAWIAKARVDPVDQIDLNRVFPGEPHADAPTCALAGAVFSSFVQSCDALIDLHSGGVRLVHLPMVGWYSGANESERLARAFGLALMPWLIPDVAGVLSYEAHRAGKIALGAEWGGGARLDPAGVDAYTNGIRRVLTMLAGIPLEEDKPDTRRPIAGSYQTVEQGGLFVAGVNLGDHVTPASILGQLFDSLGALVAEVKPSRNGIVAALAHRALLEPGDRVAYIG